MIARLQDYISVRIPLVFRKRNKIIYFQEQYNVAREDGLNAGMYIKMSKLGIDESPKHIGKYILNLLNEYHEKADMLPEDVYALTNLSMIEYKSLSTEMILNFIQAKDSRDDDLNYTNCFIEYNLNTNTYEFGLGWIEKKGKHYFNESSNSLGDDAVMTFDTPLVFDDNVDPEALGKMLFEAFDRCQMLTDKASGDNYSKKKIELLDGTILEFEEPRDKQFVDFEDGGVAEIYQLYSYLANEEAESLADFYIGIAAELDCNLEHENIKRCWEKYYGVADSFEVGDVKYGVFKYRAEFNNKKIHRISYFLQQDEDLILECAFSLNQPNRRKKLNDKLTELFEEFAAKCKM